MSYSVASLTDFLAWVAEKKFRCIYPYSEPYMQKYLKEALSSGLIGWYRGGGVRFRITDAGRLHLRSFEERKAAAVPTDPSSARTSSRPPRG